MRPRQNKKGPRYASAGPPPRQPLDLELSTVHHRPQHCNNDSVAETFCNIGDVAEFFLSASSHRRVATATFPMFQKHGGCCKNPETFCVWDDTWLALDAADGRSKIGRMIVIISHKELGGGD